MATNNGYNITGSTPLPYVRSTVRDLLLASPAYHELPRDQQREMASLMVRVCDTAARLVKEELDSTEKVQSMLAEGPSTGSPSAGPPARAQALPSPARTLAAGDEFSGVAAQRIAGTTRAVLNAVSFPAFVTDLINGVFKAMTDSNLKQMQSYIDLLNNVAASTEGFASLNYAPNRARQWLVDQFPSAYMLEGEESEEEEWGNGWGDDGDNGLGGASEKRVITRPGAQRPSDEALRAALNLPDDAPVPSGDPDTVLVPLVRQRLARTRQETLATLVRLGMQRIVVEGGRINAAMRFHIDTRSAAQADEGSTFDFRNTVNAAGSFGYGPWGVSASTQNTIGYVSTSQTQTTEEMNVDLDLDSSVEIIFRTDQVPLNRLANADQTARILANSRNPDAETRIYSEERRARRGSSSQTDQARRGALRQITTPRRPPPPRSGEPGTEGAARQDRDRASGRVQPTTDRPAGSVPGQQTGTTPQTRPATPARQGAQPAPGQQPRQRTAAGGTAQPATPA